MTQASLSVEGLGLEGAGRSVLEDVQLQLHAGEVLGLVGPTGSGKTALLRVLASLIAPTKGRVCLNGVDLWRERLSARRQLSYVAADAAAYPRLRVNEYLEFFARAAGNRDPHALHLALELAQLGSKASKPIHTLAPVEKHRLQVARALLVDPQLLLIDEPTTPLDRGARSTLYELATDLASLGKIVVIAARSGQELAQVCTQIGAMQAGRMLLQRASLIPPGASVQLDLFRSHDVVADTRRVGSSILRLRIWPLNDPAALAELLATEPEIDDVQIGERVQIRHHGADRFVAELVRKVTAAGFDVVGVEQLLESEHEAAIAGDPLPVPAATTADHVAGALNPAEGKDVQS